MWDLILDDGKCSNCYIQSLVAVQCSWVYDDKFLLLNSCCSREIEDVVIWIIQDNGCLFNSGRPGGVIILPYMICDDHVVGKISR